LIAARVFAAFMAISIVRGNSLSLPIKNSSTLIINHLLNVFVLLVRPDLEFLEPGDEEVRPLCRPEPDQSFAVFDRTVDWFTDSS
jgi:hypothetical protein